MKSVVVISLFLFFVTGTGATVSTNTDNINIREMEVQIKDQELSVKRIKSASNNNRLIIWVAPGFGIHQRAMDMSKKIAAFGTEIWHVDLAESLFMPKSTQTMRKLTGEYLKGLIEYAHKTTNKPVVLLTRSYGAIPVLRAIRLWQLAQPENKPLYLQGAILFSPELYATVPELGLEPVFVNIVEATNMPLMIFQGEKRSNRWQVDKLLKKLEIGGALTYYKLLKGVTGIFYSKDKSAQTLKQLNAMPVKILRAFNLLAKTAKPAKAAVLKNDDNKKSQSLNIKLKKFRGNTNPHPFNLLDVNNKRFVKNNYKGKVTVVNFWATWCPPCVQEIPSLNHLKEIMRDKNFELISINYGEDKKTIEDFMQKINVDFPVLLDPDGKQAAKWKVLVFPSTFVIGVDGKIKYGVNAAIHWDAPSVVKQLKALLD